MSMIRELSKNGTPEFPNIGKVIVRHNNDEICQIGINKDSYVEFGSATISLLKTYVCYGKNNYNSSFAAIILFLNGSIY